MSPNKTALLLATRPLKSSYLKTAHGLARKSDRFKIIGMVNPLFQIKKHSCENPFSFPIYPNLETAEEKLKQLPDFCIIGEATDGGYFTPELLGLAKEAAKKGISIVNGLHDSLADHPEFKDVILDQGIEIIDIRKSKKFKELHFWTGKIREVKAPRVAILGTDCAVGKRTTTVKLLEGLIQQGVQAQMIYTGQTGWLQGFEYGFILDSTPNDFVSGELEHAIYQCDQETQPDLILIEGQSALRNPSGPCGAELLLSAEAKGCILVHSPKRKYFEGLESIRYPLFNLSEEAALLHYYRSELLGVALNEEDSSPVEIQKEQQRIQKELGVPVSLPLSSGVDTLVEVLRKVSRNEFDSIHSP